MKWFQVPQEFLEVQTANYIGRKLDFVCFCGFKPNNALSKNNEKFFDKCGILYSTLEAKK